MLTAFFSLLLESSGRKADATLRTLVTFVAKLISRESMPLAPPVSKISTLALLMASRP